MTQEEFSAKLKQSFSGMVQLAFEYVGRNSQEVDNVYVFATAEGSYFYNCFFRINGTFCFMHQVNDLLEQKVDMGRERMFSVLKMGAADAHAMCELIEGFQGKSPTLITMNYAPKTGKFSQEMSYERNYSHLPDTSASDVFMAWQAKIAGV